MSFALLHSRPCSVRAVASQSENSSNKGQRKRVVSRAQKPAKSEEVQQSITLNGSPILEKAPEAAPAVKAPSPAVNIIDPVSQYVLHQ